ncbi:AAA family ATPase [Streptomyces triculaminicus]|uniref:AAA family ATPase n=3 Tax=Streptomyces TaxID=1883 RepID=A0A939FQ18_9ACTN|nr:MULTISPECIES: LuxR family transcriptional regulator [Streptomyces]MBO0656045.1 AAA family ATPase [Streptomyces triculaminicus]QSY50036.1 AAA family ATPase [Streptomyces griseocarneus]
MAVSFHTHPGDPRHLTGRTAELRALTTLAARARAGTARAVLVRGPAGIGRTSLLTAAADHLRSEGVAVRRHTAPRVTDEHTPRAAAATPRDPYAAHRRLYGHVSALLADGPLAFVLDDAQWCAEATLRRLDFVLRRAAARPLFLLLSQRTDCGGPGAGVLAEMLGQGRCTLMELGPLDDAATARLVTYALGEHPDDRFVRRCADVTGGNPQLLHRLLASLRGSGVRPDAAGAHHVAAAAEGAVASSVPDRLAGRPRHVRQIARALAVLGRADPDLLSVVCEVSGHRTRAALEILRRAEVVTPGEAGAPGVMHAPVRAAVLADLPPAELRHLRVRAARLLNDAGRPAAEVADQLVPLERLDEPWMLPVLREAAAGARWRGTTEAAVRYLRRALDAGPDDAQRREIRLELARAAAPLSPTTALRHLRQALDASTGPRERAPIAVEYGMAALGTPGAPDAVRALAHVLDELPGDSDRTPAGRELRTSVRAALLVTAVNDKAAMAGVRERAAAWPVPDGDTPAERRLLSVLSAFAALEGAPAVRAAELARRALRVEEAAPAGWWVFGSSLVLGLADEVDEALAGLERSLRDTRARHEPWMHVSALAARSLTLHDTGRVDAAVRDARAAVDAAARSERTTGSAMPHIALGTALLTQGRTEEAAAALARIVHRDTERHIWEWHHYLYAQGRVRRELGDHEGALDLWLRCGRSLDEARVANPVLAPWWLPAAATLARLGRAGEARDIVERVTPSLRRWGTPRALGTGLMAAAAAATGRARLDLLAEAAGILARSPARLEHTKAAYLLGRCLLAQGDARAARRHLRQAIEVATRCGYQALGAAARAALVTAGGRMPQLAASPLDTLTGSERRIAALAQGGVTNKAIAEALFITPRTVETHLTNVYRKLAVRGRTDLPGGLGGYGPPLPV